MGRVIRKVGVVGGVGLLAAFWAIGCGKGSVDAPPDASDIPDAPFDTSPTEIKPDAEADAESDAEADAGTDAEAECLDETDCDDENECTTDACEDGVCENVAVADGEQCAGGLGECVDGECEVGCAGDEGCPASGPACVIATCNLETGVCEYNPDNTECEDTGNPCTVSLCDEAAGCQPTNVDNGADCATAGGQDGACQEGVCVLDAECSEPGDCENDDECMDADCIGTPGQCDYNAKEDGSPCMDATSNVGYCQAGTCIVDCTSDLDCDDGNACNGTEACDLTTGTCLAGTPLSCDDGNVCNGTETCDPILGCEPGTPLSCDDGDPCTGAETCDPTSGCVAGTPLSCDDGNACTTNDCDPTTGCTATPITCDDGDRCTTDACDPASGCAFTSVCDDSDPCTVGVCDPRNGRCTYTAVEPLWNDWVAIDAALWRACGLRADGTAWCWGKGDEGQRGDGTLDATQTTPVQVLAAGEAPGGATWSDWVSIVLGGGALNPLGGETPDPRSCGIRGDGSLWCWGKNALARGDGTTQDLRSTPSRVLASGEQVGGGAWQDWVQVAVGRAHTCGLRADGSAWCWGENEEGQLGDGTTSARATPVQVVAADEQPGGPAWNDWTQLAAAGGEHTCGLRADGSLWCWGGGVTCTSSDFGCFTWEPVGERGDGTLERVRTTPVQVVATGEPAGGTAWEDWTEVTAGRDHTCGRRLDGSAWCWGFSARLGAAVPWSHPDIFRRGVGIPYPVQVLAEGEEAGGLGWTDWVAVHAEDASLYTYGLREAGTLWRWHSTAPRAVAAGCGAQDTHWSDWIAVATGPCALRSDGTAWCWGSGLYGSRGDGRTDYSSIPTPVGAIR
jgi:alpha-tubulin suppressor-like RCC1 family protein